MQLDREISGPELDVGAAARALIGPHLTAMKVACAIDRYFGKALWWDLFRGMPADLAAVWLANLVARPGASNGCPAWRLAKGLADSRVARRLFWRNEVYLALRSRAEENGRTLAEEKADVMLGAMLGAAKAGRRRQTVRLGAQWVTDEDGKKEELVPLYDLSAEKAVWWFTSKAREIAEASILDEPWEGRSRRRIETVPLHEHFTASTSADPNLVAQSDAIPESIRAAGEFEALRQRVTSGQLKVLEALLRQLESGYPATEAKARAADELNVSVNTVDQHFSRIRSRCSRSDLQPRCQEDGVWG